MAYAVVNRISTSAFTLELSERGANRLVLALQGELDVSVAIEARRLVEEELNLGNDMVIDLSGLEFVDSSGLFMLLRVNELAASLSRSFSIVGPLQSQVRRALRITGLDALLLGADGAG